MIGMNYSIQNQNGPLPLGTPVVAIANGAALQVNADPVNAGRYQIMFPASGAVMAAVFAPGCQLVYNDVIPASGGEASTNNPMVLLPLS
jgi:hypothetical protein